MIFSLASAIQFTIWWFVYSHPLDCNHTLFLSYLFHLCVGSDHLSFGLVLSFCASFVFLVLFMNRNYFCSETLKFISKCGMRASHLVQCIFPNVVCSLIRLKYTHFSSLAFTFISIQKMLLTDFISALYWLSNSTEPMNVSYATAPFVYSARTQSPISSENAECFMPTNVISSNFHARNTKKNVSLKFVLHSFSLVIIWNL